MAHERAIEAAERAHLDTPLSKSNKEALRRAVAAFLRATAEDMPGFRDGVAGADRRSLSRLADELESPTPG